MVHIRWLMATMLLAAAASVQAAEIIGRVLVAVGEVSAVRAGRSIPLQATSPVEAGDRVRTGAASNAQIRLTDESIVALRPNTEFAFTEFRYSGREDGNERAIFRLLKGGLRTITGLVGRSNHQNYRLETATATIGIRGTHYVLVMCEQDCVNADGSRAPDGLYGNATGFSFGTNQVSATNKTGERVFGVNQPFHVPDINTEPRRLIAPPEFLADRLIARDRNLTRGGGRESAGDGGGARSDGRSAARLAPPRELPAVATEQRNSEGQLAALTTGPGLQGAGVIPAVGAGAATHFFDSVGTDSRPLMNASLSVDAQGQLTAISDGAFNAVRGTTGVVDAGSHFQAGNLHWGMWPNADVNGSPVAFLHFIVGNVASLPGGGTFIYQPVGGTLPTNAAGLAGTFIAGTITVNFGIKDLQLNGWQVGLNGATYTQSGPAGTSFTSPTFSNSMTWSCSGSCGGNTSPVSGSFAGSFTGAGAPGMGVAYRVFDVGNNGEVVGVQGFKR